MYFGREKILVVIRFPIRFLLSDAVVIYYWYMHKSINSWVLHRIPRIVAKMILFAKKLVSLILIDSQTGIILVQLLDWNIIVLLPNNCKPNSFKRK